MAAPLLPQDVTEHLTAAIQLSAKHIHLRFLEEFPYRHGRAFAWSCQAVFIAPIKAPILARTRYCCSGVLICSASSIHATASSHLIHPS